MSWIGLRHKGVEPLYPDEWNRVVDALDILYGYSRDLSARVDNLENRMDCLEAKVDEYYLETKRELNIIEDKIDKYYFVLEKQHEEIETKIDKYYLEIKSELTSTSTKIDQYYGALSSQHEEIKTKLGELDSKVEKYYLELYREVEKPKTVDTYTLLVGVTPVPLSEVDLIVKRIHLKVPSWTQYIIYLGDEVKQEFVLEPGDKEIFEVENPRKVYVYSLGEVKIYVALEL